MASKATKRKGKTKICEKLKEVEDITEETKNILQLIKKEPNKEETNDRSGQDDRETDCARS